MTVLNVCRKSASNFWNDGGNSLRNLQKGLSANTRNIVRKDSNILKDIFDLKSNSLLDGDCGYWDSTTLSLTLIIEEFIRKKRYSTYLDLGCGPYATLGCFVKKKFPEVSVTSVDINIERVYSAKKFASFNNLEISCLQSNLFESINNKFELISFNPPYIRSDFDDLEKLELSEEETKSGIYHESKNNPIFRFVNDYSKFLESDGLAMLGINNYFISDSQMNRIFKNSSINKDLFGRYYYEESCMPNGGFSQVYISN